MTLPSSALRFLTDFTGRRISSVAAPKIRMRMSWQGKFFTFVLLIIFVGSMNFQNNLGILTAVFVFYSIIISGVLTRRIVSGITLTTGAVQPVFCGDYAALALSLTGYRGADNFLLQVQLQTNSESITAPLCLNPKLTQQYIQLPTTRRGRHTITRITLIASHRLGMVDALLSYPVHIDYLVYPAPATLGRELIHTEQRKINQTSLELNDYFGQRPYIPGDSIKHINWKSFAGSKGLHTDIFIDGGDQLEWIDWSQFHAEDVEIRLAQICRTVLDLSSTHQDYGLRLPGLVIEPGHGVLQREQCLTALADFGGSDIPTQSKQRT